MGNSSSSLSESQTVIYGVIDGLTSGVLAGWVFDPAFPEVSQSFSVEVDGVIVSDSIAHCYREDLVDHGFKYGKHGFFIDLGLTNDQVRGKVIRLLDKRHQPILGATYKVIETENQVLFELLSHQDHHFEFAVTCSKEVEVTQLFMRYGGACVSLMSVHLPEGESRLLVTIPLGIVDGFSDFFSIELMGFPAPVWIAKQFNFLLKTSNYIDNRSNSVLSFIERMRHESLDLHVKNASNPRVLDSPLSAYHYLLTDENNAVLNYTDKEQVDVSIFISFQENVNSDDFLRTLASILFAYNRCSFELFFIVSEQQKIMLLDIMSTFNVECHYFSFTGFDTFYSSIRERARGKYFVIVNRAIEALRYWLDELILPFNQSMDLQPDVTTSKTVSIDGEVLAPASFSDVYGQLWYTEQSVNSRHPSVNYVRGETRRDISVWCTSSALFYEALSRIDNSFKLLPFDINSLSYGREKGLNIVYIPQSEVLGADCLVNTMPSFSSQMVKKKRILLIDHALPSVGEDAGSYAAVQEIKLIQSLGYEVVFVDFKVSYDEEKKASNLQKIGVEVIYRPFFSSLESVIHRYISDVSAIYITRYNVADRVLPIIKKVDSNIPVIFNNADLHFLRELRSALNLNDPEKIRQATVTRERELSVMRRVDAILSYNNVEHAVIISHLLESRKIYTCPWVLDEKLPGLSFEDRKGIAFLGGYAHSPNVEAVNFFVEKVAPLLALKAPDIIFYVYGSEMPNSFNRFTSSNVKLKGFVDCLDDLYNKHRVFVAPLLSGAGIKGKVLESLAYGLPTVLSSIASEGIGLSHNITTLQAETPEEWCTEIIRLYQDKTLWNRISENQKVLAENKYSFASGKKQMQKILSSVGLH